MGDGNFYTHAQDLHTNMSFLFPTHIYRQQHVLLFQFETAIFFLFCHFLSKNDTKNNFFRELLDDTTIHQIAQGDRVNLEFDIIGKYVQQYMKAYENR